MTIEAYKVYRFEKSGNLVRTIEPAGKYQGHPLWLVERTEGPSTGKRMHVPARALGQP